MKENYKIIFLIVYEEGYRNALSVSLSKVRDAENFKYIYKYNFV